MLLNVTINGESFKSSPFMISMVTVLGDFLVFAFH